jgi:hypothetical protein
MRSEPICSSLVNRPRSRRFTALALSGCLALLPSMAMAADANADENRRSTSDRSLVVPSDLARIKRGLDSPADPLLHKLSGLSADADFVRAALNKPRKGWRTLSHSQSQGASGSGSSHGDGWLALAITGSVVGLTGAVLGSYGDSNNCHSKNPLYLSGGSIVNVCDNYSKAGVGLAVGGLAAIIVGVVGAIASSSRQPGGSSTSAQGASGGGATPPPIYAGAGQSANVAGFDAARQAIDEIRSQNPGSLPPAQVTGSSRGGTTTLEIKNNTEYTLHVFLAGPQSEVLNLLPGYSQKITIAPGQYEIAARVDAFNVRSFYGTQPFAGSTAYGESFYIRGR